MVNLFDISENYTVELNKEWVMMIPEFAAVVKADKGSKGDGDGRKKLKAKRQLSYIYFMVDPRSPIYEWEFEEKKAEALRYAEIKKEDVTSLVDKAYEVYEKMCSKASRALRTYHSVLKSLDSLDKYYEDIDFTAKDKKGELVHNVSQFVLNLQRLGPAYDSLEKFRTRVMNDIKSSAGIRGNSTLGYYEGGTDKRAMLYSEARTELPEEIKELTEETDNEVILKDFSVTSPDFKKQAARLVDMIPKDMPTQGEDELEDEDLINVKE